MQKFFQSQLCANFWKFSLLAPIMSGLLTALLTCLVAGLSATAADQLKDLPMMAVTIGGIAAGMTFLPAIVGFWLVWYVGRLQKLSFSTVSIMTALFLCLIVLFVALNPEALFQSSGKLFMVAIDVALLGSVLIFYKLSKKYIEPVLF